MATKTYRNFQQVSEHFKCPVHIGKLKEPRRLPCEHTLCKDCLKGVIKTALSRRTDGLFECPECRTKHHIPITETEDWADWFPVDAFTIIQLQTLARFQDSPVCEKHMDKFKEYYCFHHRTIYCPDCVIEYHTKSPCYCRNNNDAFGEVRKHVSDLLGELRLQEERVERVSESKMAAKHIDDLLQKVWEVEHMVDRFHRTMKKKLMDTRQQLEDVTKISPADREHLRTVHALITKTKQHVESKLRDANPKTKDGQNDMLLLWKPLDEEVKNFKRVLNAVERRPFCVNVQADEPFLDLLTLNQDPIVVLDESTHWTPLSYKDDAKDNQVKKKVSLRQDPDKLPPLKDKKNISTSTTTLSKASSKERQQTMYQKVQEKMYIENKDRLNVNVILPKVATAVATGTTSRTFSVKHLKLRGISLQSTFEFPCEDIIVMDNNIITITERAVQKFSLRYQFLQSLALRGPMKMTPMKDSHNILVLDSNNAITMVATTPRLQLLYRVEPDRQYLDFCHLKTTSTEDPFGRVLYHCHLAVSHLWNREDCIDLMILTYEKSSFMFGFMEEVTLKPAKVKTITGSNDEAMLRHITSLSRSMDGKHIFVGAESGITCLNRSGDVIWTYQTDFYVVSIDSKKTYVFAAIEKERRVLILNQHGTLLVENIFPSGCVITKPIRLSIGKASMIVREYNDEENKSLVHVFNLSFFS